jgi:hypothetical protein
MHLCQIDARLRYEPRVRGRPRVPARPLPEILDVLPTRRPATLVIGTAAPGSGRAEAPTSTAAQHRAA